MSKIDLGTACDTNEVTNYLDNKEGGGGSGVTQQYVDDQDAIVQANVDAEAVTREEADTALETRIVALEGVMASMASMTK